jgi:hypothetical protein
MGIDLNEFPDVYMAAGVEAHAGLGLIQTGFEDLYNR